MPSPTGTTTRGSRAARRSVELLERRPRLDRELKDLEKTERKLASERRNLLDAVAGNGSRSPGVFEKLGEVEAEFDTVTRRLEQLRAELAALDHQAIDEKDLRAALASFEPVWTELFPAERSRILHLLIEEVRYDVEAGEVAITFRPGGVRSLAREDGRETA